jgi:hypothetical protein
VDDLDTDDRLYLSLWFSVPISAYEPGAVPEAVGRRRLAEEGDIGEAGA